MSTNKDRDALSKIKNLSKAQQKEIKGLKEQLDLYQKIFEYAPDPYYLNTLSGTFIDGNRAAEKAVGYKRDALIGQSFLKLKLLLPQDIGRAAKMLGKNALGKSTGPDEFTLIRKDGSHVILEISTYPLRYKKKSIVLGIARDITNRKESEEELIQFKLMIDASKDYISLINRDYVYEAANDAYIEARQKTRAEVIGHSVKKVWGEKKFNDFIKDKLNKCFKGEIINHQSAFQFVEDEMNYMDVTYYPCRNTEGKITHAVVVSHNITEIKRSEEKIKHLAYHDTLTNLPNRLQFADRLTLELSHAKRNRTKVAVLFLDLDQFKKINDTFGHDVGDKLLKGVAERLSRLLRKSDTISRREGLIDCLNESISRLGGDEFTLIIPNLIDQKFSAIVAKKIIESFKVPYIINKQEFFTTTSIGISIYPDDGSDCETLLKNADTAMYRAKDLGRNNYQYYSEEMNENSLQRMDIENKLHYALEKNEFEIYYQPQISLNRDTLVGTEALLRWKNKEMGLVMPDDFIPIAEETGMIIPIGNWVLQHACRQMKEWHDEGMTSLKLAINLSARQFQDKDLIKNIKKALDETSIGPSYLEIEITESTMMQNFDLALEITEQLKRMGLSIALDDFGTGFSSLRYLQKFPIDVLKIDKSFIFDMEKNQENEAIVSAIISMAHSLHMKVIAEGVELNEHRSYLAERGCEEVQGFFYSKPLPKDEFKKYAVDGK
ncbi:EAL domain-containing protein [Spirochaetota bacterium]